MLDQFLSQFLADPRIASRDPVIAWVMKLQAALPVWRGVMASGIRCACLKGRAVCDAPAIGACLVCRHTTCLGCALVDAKGNIACVPCLNELLRSKGSAPSEPKTDDEVLVMHLGRLGLKPPSTLTAVNKAFRNLAKQHPDHGGNSAEFARITASHAWLKERMSS